MFTPQPFGSANVTSDAVTVYAQGFQLSEWARRPGAVWPCSALARLDSIRATFDSGGLIELECVRDGKDDAADDLLADELNAWSSDVLREVLNADHPSYYVTVGQFS